MAKKFKIRRKWPEAIFSGSLIQQNHGEELKHGYYEWDVEDNKAEFQEIENEYGYYTLYIKNGVIPVLSDVPTRPRLRLKVINTNPADLKRIVADVRKLYNVQELTINRIDSIGDSDDSRKLVNVGDVSSTSYQNDLIIDYIKRNFVVDDSMITTVQEINTRLNQKLDEEELAKSINWKPVRFEFSNMFSYGEDNVIDFTDMNGIVGIFAENASGKSSIFGALSFCLFDKAPRAYKAVNILNTKKDWFSCKLEFKIDKTTYFIERSGKKDSTGHVPVDVDFYKVEDSERVNLNGEHRRDTDRIIRQYVGEYEDFILTTLSVQNNNTVFIDKSQSERKDVLAQFIGIDVFDKLYTLAKDESRDLKAVIKEFEKDDLSERVAEAEKKYDRLVEEYEELQDQKSELLDEKSDLVSRIMELNQKMVDVPDKDLDIDRLQSKIVDLEEKIESLSEKIKEKTIKKKEKEQAKLGLENVIEPIDEASLKEEYDQIQEKRDKIDSLKSERSYLKRSLDKHRSSLDHLKEHSEFDPDCEYCVQRNEKDVKKIDELKQTIDNETDQLDEINSRIDSLIEEVENNKVEERWEKFNDINGRIKRHERFISERDLEISKLENKKQSLESQYEKTQSDIELYNQIKDNLRHNKEIQVEINHVENDLNVVESDIDSIEFKIRSVHGDIKVTENTKKEINKKIERFQDLSKEYEAYEYYLNAIKRDGVPYELIEKSLPGIEEEVNNILSQIVDFAIMFETDGKNINAWMVSGEDDIVPLDNASGMEGFVSSLAIRVALTNISNLPRSSFLAIDEGFGVLDAEKRSSLMMVFDYFKTNFDFVLFVTHLDSLRDIANDILEVQKQNQFSKVLYE